MMLRILWIDKFGRVYLPEDIRETYHLYKETYLALLEGGENDLILRSYKPVCTVCGSDKEVSIYNNTPFCGKCLRKLDVMPPLEKIKEDESEEN